MIAVWSPLATSAAVNQRNPKRCCIAADGLMHSGRVEAIEGDHCVRDHGTVIPVSQPFRFGPVLIGKDLSGQRHTIILQFYCVLCSYLHHLLAYVSFILHIC